MFYSLGFRVQGAPAAGFRFKGLGYGVSEWECICSYKYICVHIHIISSCVHIWGRHIDREREVMHGIYGLKTTVTMGMTDVCLGLEVYV